MSRYEDPKAKRLRRTGWTTVGGQKERDGEYVRLVDQDDRYEHNLILSLSAEEGDVSFPDEWHYPVLDIDGPVRIVSTPTPGHFHLFIDKRVHREAYFEFLHAAAMIGLIEWGYYDAAEANGMTCAFKQEY